MLQTMKLTPTLRPAWLILAVGLAGCSFTASAQDDAVPKTDALGIDGRLQDAGGVDAAPSVDAAIPPTPFDVSTCPVAYKTVGNVTTSRYRAAAEGISISWGAAAQACEADSADTQPSTHLVVFESLSEYNAVVPTLQAEHSHNYTWTGAFRYFDGIVLRFDTVTGQEAGLLDPFKLDSGARQNLTVYPRATFLLGTDYRYSNNPVDNRYNYICECDGRPGGKRPQ